MIYLFNSASRPLYAIDALNVLALPIGATVVHRYRVRGENCHVHPDLYNGIMRDRPAGAMRVWNGRDWIVRLASPLCLVGLPTPEAETVLILYVDRHGPSGYVYHLLRRGKLFEVWEGDDRVYFRVRLESYVAAPSEQAARLSDEIKQALSDKNPPTLISGSPDAKNDGYYAVQGPDAFHGRQDLLQGDSAWVASVEALAASQNLRSSPTRTVVFLRSRIHRLVSDQPEPPRLRGGAERIHLRKDAIYELRVSYRCPAHVTASGTLARLHIQHGANLQVLEADMPPVNAAADQVRVPFTTKRYVEDPYSFVRLDVKLPDRADAPVDPGSGAGTVSQSCEVLGPKLNVVVALREGRWFLPSMFTALGLFVLAGLVVGVEAAELAGVLPVDLPRAIWAQITPARGAAAIVQAFALVWLFRLLGKKLV